MLASVARLRPRVGSFPEALTAFRAARLRECLTELHGNETIEGTFLRARVQLRLGFPDAALIALRDVGAEENRDRAELSLLRAIGQSRVGNEIQAQSSFQEAFVFGVSAMDCAIEAEVQFYLGLSAFGGDDLKRARGHCEKALVLAIPRQTFGALQGSVPLEHVVARTQELLGLVEAAEGQYRAFFDQARASLVTLDSCEIPDLFQEAFALRNLAILARDFDIETDAAVLMGRAQAFAWTEDIRRVEFTTAEALGWCSALRGNNVEALRLFRRAERAASSDPERIMVGVDRALFAREFGHLPMVIEEVEHALDIADAFDWEKAAGDYRVALLTLAQAAASISGSRARMTLDRYTSIRNAMDGTFVARVEPRARAEEAYTHGLVLRAEGRLSA